MRSMIRSRRLSLLPMPPRDRLRLLALRVLYRFHLIG